MLIIRLHKPLLVKTLTNSKLQAVYVHFIVHLMTNVYQASALGCITLWKPLGLKHMCFSTHLVWGVWSSQDDLRPNTKVVVLEYEESVSNLLYFTFIKSNRYYFTTFCNFAILYYTLLNYTTVLHSTLQYCTILYYTTVLYYTILHYTLLYYAIIYGTILHYTVLNYTTLGCIIF